MFIHVIITRKANKIARAGMKRRGEDRRKKDKLVARVVDM
jgi:hypothetical protein